MSVRRWVASAITVVVGAYATWLLIGNPIVWLVYDGHAGEVPLGDFGSFYASGLAASQGLDPFDVYPLTLDAGRGRGNGAAPNLNAPLSVPIFQAFTLVDPVVGRWVWFVCSLLAYFVTLVLVLRARPVLGNRIVVAWAFALAGLSETLVLGQVYAVLALVSTLAWLMLDRRPTIASGLIGFLIAFKPVFLVWPVLLFVAGHRRSALLTLAAAAAFGLLPALIYGPQVYREWLVAILSDGPNAQVANASLVGEVARLGMPAPVGLLCAAALLVGLSVWAYLRRPSAQSTSEVALSGSLLASPIAWIGYTLFLLPLASHLRPTTALVGALLIFPRWVLQERADTSDLARMTIGSAYTLAWLLLLRITMRASDSCDSDSRIAGNQVTTTSLEPRLPGSLE